MRLYLVVSLALFLSPAAFAEDPARPVESKIARVTVYEDRALVTRAAQATLAQGTSRVAFDHLPPGLDPASIRARCGSARVLGVDVEQVHLVREGREDLAKAVAAHDAARRKVAAAEMELAEAKDRWDLFRSIRAKGVEGGERALGGGAGVDVKSLKDLIELVGAQGASARQSVLAATDGLAAAKAEEQAAGRRVDELRTGSDRTESRVLVTLQADAAADAVVSVQYMVLGAAWRPVYDLRVDEDFGAASLGLSAVVVQKTGESWNDVPLEFTTAQPSAGAAPPEPLPWRIHLPSPGAGGFMAVEKSAPAASPAKLARKARADAAKGEDDEIELAAELKEAGYAPTVRRSGLVVAFASQLAESIASDGQPARVALARFDMKPDVRWTAFPRATDKVFVTAKMSNSTSVALPAGEARVFVGSDFVGPLALKDWSVGKEIDVGLGVDRDVEVERERLKDERSTEGVFSKDTVHTQAFRLSVKNHRDRSIHVRLLDQVPVSDDEDLVVKVLEQSRDFAKLPDRDAETNKARGVLEWRYDLAAKTDDDVRFTFEVRHPKSKEAYGLGD
jgi:uncharacterized protein (TIGR02231 family)